MKTSERTERILLPVLLGIVEGTLIWSVLITAYWMFIY